MRAASGVVTLFLASLASALSLPVPLDKVDAGLLNSTDVVDAPVCGTGQKIDITFSDVTKPMAPLAICQGVDRDAYSSAKLCSGFPFCIEDLSFCNPKDRTRHFVRCKGADMFGRCTSSKDYCKALGGEYIDKGCT
ncbi:hypothetical protein HGRIS_002819 [Hohenbuehelia grisea]|uniref:Uncharacterized protein n=1 Tax=Hohenbuehelia grisea TaxID=104357 RepID=A0ABR3JN19_9AGAR